MLATLQPKRPRVFRVLLCISAVVAMIGCAATPTAPTPPDIQVASAVEPASSCQSQRSEWQQRLSAPNALRARATGADLDPHESPLPLITNFWVPIVPILVQLYPDRNMVMDVALTGWRFDGSCGPLRPGIQVDFEVSMKVDIAGQLVDLFTYKYLGHSMHPEATFDPVRPWSFTYRQPLTGFLDKTYVGDFPPEQLFHYTPFFLRDAKARP